MHISTVGSLGFQSHQGLRSNNPVRTFHHFLRQSSGLIVRTWEAFKELFTKESEETKMIRSLLDSKTVNWEASRDQVAALLISTKPYSRQGHLLKALLKRADQETLKTILYLAFDKMFESSRFEYEKLQEFLQPGAVRSFVNDQDIQELYDCLDPIYTPNEKKVESEIKKTLRVVFRFFPNFMDTFLKAFNLIDAGKGPESIFDFSMMLEIYFKLFMLPFTVFLIAGSVGLFPWQALLLTGIVILVAIAGICAYLKFRPCPSQLPRARNWSEEAACGKFLPVVERDQEIQTMSAILGKKEDGVLLNLILVGEPGVGKTELVKGLAQHYKEKIIFALNSPELASGFTSVSDKLRFIFMNIKGHEDNVVFFLDEFGEAIKKNPKVNISGYLKPLLEDDGVQVIAALTNEEYNELIASDKSLEDRFWIIDVKPTTKEQTLSILQQRMETKGHAVRFEPNIEEEVIRQTEDKQQPRHAVKLLNLAINRVRGFDAKAYMPSELLDALRQLKRKQRAYRFALDNQDRDQRAAIAGEIRTLKEKINRLQVQTKQIRDMAEKTHTLIKRKHILDRVREQLSKADPANDRLPFLHGVLCPWMESKIKSLIEKYKEIPLQVDKALIRQLAAEGNRVSVSE